LRGGVLGRRGATPDVHPGVVCLTGRRTLLRAVGGRFDGVRGRRGIPRRPFVCLRNLCACMHACATVQQLCPG